MTTPSSGSEFPIQSPLFHAENASRYERQAMIAQYQQKLSCKIVVVVDAIFAPSITYFEELIYDCDSKSDLHLLLASPGGDGDTAVRMLRAALARCRELTVIVPDQAKSAATLLALGAHHILMGPASDLGPIDPQFLNQQNGGLVSAKDIIAAVEDATQKVQEAPNTYPVYASLLSDVTALMVQQARSALDRSEDLLEEALKSNGSRSDREVQSLKENLIGPLIEQPKTHSALFSSKDAMKAGLPIIEADLMGYQWQMVWRLWTKYFVLGTTARVYEGERVSQVTDWSEGDEEDS